MNLTGTGAPYIGEVLDHAFDAAQAVVVLLTPDEIAYLRREYATGDNDPELQPTAQARPNVLFEAGMAFGRHPRRTVLVECGDVRPFSDVAGRHSIRIDGSVASRKALAERLKAAGCPVVLSGSDWLNAGDLTPPPPPGGGLPLGRRLPTDKPPRIRLDAIYIRQGKSSGRLQITNHSTFAIHDLSFEIPPEAGSSFQVDTSALPITRLPSGKTASFPAIRTHGPGADHFEITITGLTPEGNPVREEVFINLLG